MFPSSPSDNVAIRLYGGADDGGIIDIPMRHGQEPMALVLSTGTFIATGLPDSAGLLIFALVGTEESLWLCQGSWGQAEES